jgi:hypothetical protein
MILGINYHFCKANWQCTKLTSVLSSLYVKMFQFKLVCDNVFYVIIIICMVQFHSEA